MRVRWRTRGYRCLARPPFPPRRGAHHPTSPPPGPPEAAGHGLGGSLLNAGIARCEASGETTVVVFGEPALYGRVGFEPAADLGLAPPPHLAEESVLALRLRPGPTGIVE